MAEIFCQIWVCQDCMLVHANGECDPDRPADLPEPWAEWEGEPYTIAMGGEHREDCPNRPDSPTSGEQDCDCETDTFSTRACEGCGDYHHGDRYAFTVFTE